MTPQARRRVAPFEFVACQQVHRCTVEICRHRVSLALIWLWERSPSTPPFSFFPSPPAAAQQQSLKVFGVGCEAPELNGVSGGRSPPVTPAYGPVSPIWFYTARCDDTVSSSLVEVATLFIYEFSFLFHLSSLHDNRCNESFQNLRTRVVDHM